VNEIEVIESQSIPNYGIIKIFFPPTNRACRYRRPTAVRLCEVRRLIRDSVEIAAVRDRM
jgi:hypothetical protein